MTNAGWGGLCRYDDCEPIGTRCRDREGAYLATVGAARGGDTAWPWRAKTKLAPTVRALGRTLAACVQVGEVLTGLKHSWELSQCTDNEWAVDMKPLMQ